MYFKTLQLFDVDKRIALGNILPRMGSFDYLLRIEDFSSSPFQASLSLFPAQIVRKIERIMASITRNPIPKNIQNRTSTMASPPPLGARQCSSARFPDSSCASVFSISRIAVGR